jgi:DNA-binding NarL/FixJ family response regulator
VRVAIANDYEIIAQGLVSMLAPFSDRVEVVALTTNGPEALDDLDPIDVLLVDTFSSPDPSTKVEGWLASPQVGRVAIFTLSFDPEFIDRAFEQGVAAYLTKDTSAQELVDAVERIAKGERVVDASRSDGPGADADDGDDTDPRRHWPGQEAGLSEREGEVLSLVSDGLRNNEIAEVLFISSETVKTHLSRIYRKLDVRNRSQAVAVASGLPSFRRRAITRAL